MASCLLGADPCHSAWTEKNRTADGEALCFIAPLALSERQEMGHMACRFDGDGMLHAVRIKAGKASYSNAYVQTSLLKQEKKAGRALKLKAWLLLADSLLKSA